MSAETSNARWETYTFDMIEDAWGDAVPLTKPYFDRFRARLETLRQQSAAPQPAAARGDVRGLVDGVRRLSERWKSREIDGEPVSESKHMQLAGCAAMLDSLLDNYALAAEGVQAGEVSAYDLAVLDDAAETLDRIGEGSAGLREARARIASALSQQPEARGGGKVEDGPIDASDNAEYIEHCADRLERCGLRVTAGALRVIAHEHRTLAQQPAPPSAPVGVDAPGSRAWMAEVCREAALSLAAHGVHNDQLSKVADWIAQQPAAVDEVYPPPRNRAEAVALAKLALAHLGVIDAHIDAAIARCETDCAAQQPTAVDRARFRKAPCYLCGYNGPGYFQPETHPCAAFYHATQDQEPKS